ncbi:MAG: alpha/beta hydrolase [Methyloceanibacter sp.]|uniref:alpha/beta hydrolase n=1 Tax=Methyloceanibacter sp. TaxID=1965321 RepID=UPI003D9BABBB
MDVGSRQFAEIGSGARRRRIAYRWTGTDADDGKVALVWLSGFRADMEGTKATTVAEWARAREVPILRFDYSAHGASDGALIDATIGDWLEESIAMFDLLGKRRAIVVGSSMGGWLALLLARILAKHGASRRLAGLVLIAPAFDMTETLMWRVLPTEIKAKVEQEGVYYHASAYGDPYPITRRVIEEGRNHLLEASTFDPGCPVRIIQGMRDPDVPWRHALALVDLLDGDDVELNLIKEGDHRLSEPHDLRRLEATIAALLASVRDHR